MAQEQIKGDTGSLGSGGSLTTYTVPGSAIVTPYSISASFDGTSASGPFLPCLTFKTITGAVIARCPAPGVAQSGTAEVSWFPHVAPEESTAGNLPIAETLLLPTWASSVSSSHPLPNGVVCLVTVQGTYSAWNEVLNDGVPEADAQFPSTPPSVVRVSTEVGVDADTIFAWPSDHPHSAGHDTDFQINTGSGFAHVEPVGGPYTTPQSGHFYQYHLLGQGQPVSFRVNDSPLTDNYGAFQIMISGTPAPVSGLEVTDGVHSVLSTSEIDFTSGATVTDGGGGTAQVAITGGSGTVTSVTAADTSVVIGGTATDPTVRTNTVDVIASDHPPAANWSNNSHKITSLTAGAAAGEAAIWDQTPAGIVTAKGDLVAGTGSHAAARVAVGSDTQVLTADSTQTAGVKWAAAGGSGTISDITSTSSTITVTAPTGPTTNVDLPTSGVTAATYGDATHVGQFAVNARGIITAASAIGITGAGVATLLFSQVLGSAAASLDTGANGIPQTATHLLCFCAMRTAAGTGGGGDAQGGLRFNGDSNTNYGSQAGAVSNGVASGAGTSSGATSILRFPMANTTATASHYGQTFFLVPFYTGGMVKELLAIGFNAGSTTFSLRYFGGYWASTSAVNQITLSDITGGNNLDTGSALYIYGVT